MFVMHEDHVKLRIIFTNHSQITLDTFKIKLNKNMYESSDILLRYPIILLRYPIKISY
jgi:hypothetical protein